MKLDGTAYTCECPLTGFTVLAQHSSEMSAVCSSLSAPTFSPSTAPKSANDCCNAHTQSCCDRRFGCNPGTDFCWAQDKRQAKCLKLADPGVDGKTFTCACPNTGDRTGKEVRVQHSWEVACKCSSVPCILPTCKGVGTSFCWGRDKRQAKCIKLADGNAVDALTYTCGCPSTGKEVRVQHSWQMKCKCNGSPCVPPCKAGSHFCWSADKRRGRCLKFDGSTRFTCTCPNGIDVPASNIWQMSRQCSRPTPSPTLREVR